MKSSSTTLTLALTLALLGGCDQLQDGDGKGPVLSSLNGTITLGTDARPAGANVRVALVWYQSLFGPWKELAEEPYITGPGEPPPPPKADCAPIQDFVATQELQFTASFPIDFRLDLTSPPPSSVLMEGKAVPMMSSTPMMAAKQAAQPKVGIGVLVAYEDGNGNGKLDLCHAEGPCPDHVLGASTSMGLGVRSFNRDNDYVLYVDRDAAGPDGPSYRAGFYLLRMHARGANNVTFDLLPGTTPIALVLSEGPVLQRLVCDKGCGVLPSSVMSLGGGCTTYPDGQQTCSPPEPIPAGATVVCYEAKDSYVWSTEVCDGCRCTGKRGGYILSPGLPKPADWPCP